MGFWVAASCGSVAILFATSSTWPWFLGLAAVLAYCEAASRLYKWRWGDDLPGQTRSEYFRSVALLLPVSIGVLLVLWFTPGGLVVKLAACGVYAAVVFGALLVARRITTWEWLD